MRQMRATPENRQTVYQALRGYQTDTGRPASVQTLATRTQLGEDAVLACADALVVAGVVVLNSDDPEHPVYSIRVVSLVGDAKAQAAGSDARDVDTDRPREHRAHPQGRAQGRGRSHAVP